MFEFSSRISTVSHVLVLSAVIFVQNFFHYDVSSPLIVLLGFLIMAFCKIHRSYLKLVWPLLAVLVIGFIGVFGNEPHNILRDVSFALTPISLIFIGYWIAGNRDMWPLILKVMVIFSFVLAAIHLSAFVINPELLIAESKEIRIKAGGTGDLVVLAFVLGLFQKHFRMSDLFPSLLPRLIVMPVLFASLTLSFSRTQLLVAIVLLISLLGWASKLNRRFVLAFIMILVAYTAVAVITPADEEGSFRSKIVNSFKEITISNYQEMSSIQTNWRGFESYRAIQTFLSGDAQQYVLGQGFGALVDLGFYMPLGGEGEVSFRYIPVTHNGFVYILIKVGLLGLIFYAYFYISAFRYAVCYSHNMNNEIRFMARLLLGCVLSLIAVMYVVGGMAQMKSSESVLLLGFLMRRIGQFQPENKNLVSGRSR